MHALLYLSFVIIIHSLVTGSRIQYNINITVLVVIYIMTPHANVFIPLYDCRAICFLILNFIPKLICLPFAMSSKFHCYSSLIRAYLHVYTATSPTPNISISMLFLLYISILWMLHVLDAGCVQLL